VKFEAVPFLDRPREEKALTISQKLFLPLPCRDRQGVTRELQRVCQHPICYVVGESSDTVWRQSAWVPEILNDTVVVICLQQSRFGSIPKAVSWVLLRFFLTSAMPDTYWCRYHHHCMSLSLS